MSSPSEVPTPESVGQYRLMGRIAVGGMAEVYRAAAPTTAGETRIVVVKRMLPRIASDASARAMFAEEARIGAHVRHPNVVQVLDFGEADTHPFLVLEYMQGVDLWRLTRFLTRHGRALSVQQALYIAREMLAGLHAVHEAVDDSGARLGVIHRDVSPSNVLLSIHGEVKLGDLGIARARLREKFPGSVNDRTKGKLGYLAPEQVRGTESDRRADIFSAGVVIAELLMGRPLFAGGSELAVLLAIRDSKVHPFVEFASQLPEGLGDLIVESLAQKPARRPASAELFSSRLLPFQTEPTDQLRAEVAQMVLEALDAGPGKMVMQFTPTRSVTDPILLVEQFVNAGQDPDVATPPVHAHEMMALFEPTPAPSGAAYEVHTSTDLHYGPWSFAQVVQAVSTGQLGPLDRVAIDGRPSKALVDVPELARHLPSSTSTSANLDSDGVLRLSGEILPLEGGGIVSALGAAAIERMTVLMLCELGGVRKEVYIKDGAPAFVTSNLASELLGEYLVARGVISRGELDMALAVMPRFEGRLGDTLSALGLVEPVVLFRHIGEQVREKLLDLFLWTGGACTHYHGVAPPPSGFPLNIDGWDVLEEGLRRRVAHGLERDRIEILKTRAIVPATGPKLTAMRSSLPAHLRRFLSELDRPIKVPSLAPKLKPPANDPEQPLREALLLWHIGAVRLAEIRTD